MTKHSGGKIVQECRFFVRVRTVGASRIYLKKVVWAEGKFI